MQTKQGKASRIASAWSEIIATLGYDLRDPHLADSPERVAKSLLAWHTPQAEPPALTTFPNEPRVDELIAVGAIRFYSVCAHHGLPFGGHAAIGYIPHRKIIGLSKLARAVDHFAHRFQVQERLTAEIADHLSKALKPKGLAVVLRAEHLCMSMRGVERPGHSTVTSDLRGALRKNAAARSELLALVVKGSQ